MKRNDTQSDNCMVLEGPQNIPAIEKKLGELQPSVTRLLIPNRLKAWWFGAEAALIQFLITWARQCPGATLVTHIQEQGDSAIQLERLVRSPFGFVAIWLAQNITDRDGRSLRVLATDEADKQYDRMWFGRHQDSEQGSLWDLYEQPEIPAVDIFANRVFLTSIDHHAKWRIPQCYFQTGDLRYRDDFVALAKGIVRNATIHFLHSGITTDLIRHFGAILHELFKNTHDWARTDECGVPLRPSIRGILANANTYYRKNMADTAAQLSALLSYTEHLHVLDSRGEDSWRCLEVSVFDSGIGLARRYAQGEESRPVDLGDLSLEEEYDACEACFKKWSTSSTSSRKGLGLHEVMTTLSELRAFIRIRSGRLALYRDFIAMPYTSPTKTDKRPFLDWSTASETLTRCPSVEGVLYTILIPLPKEAER